MKTTVSELLGTKVENEEKPDQLAKELSRINTQLAIRNHRTRRVLKIIAAALLVFAALIFCNYGVELCANVAIEIHKEGCCPFASKQDRCNFSEHFL